MNEQSIIALFFMRYNKVSILRTMYHSYEHSHICIYSS